MGKEDLYITIPSFFRCPISLDVMNSPVSLCTGVTYDRSSIQRWLDNGNDTCPATMQVLHSKEFVPNRNLQRLIQIWSDSIQLGVYSESNEAILSRDQVMETIRAFESQSCNQFDSLSKIARFAEESQQNREFLAKADGFVPKLLDFLDNADGGGAAGIAVPFLEVVVLVLSLVAGGIGDLGQMKNLMFRNRQNCLSSLLVVLQQGDSDSKICAARFLESISTDNESKLLIAQKDGLIPELLKLMTENKNPSLVEASLACLIPISMPKRNKIKLVKLGAIKALTKLVSQSNPNPSVSTAEKALKLLETLSSCKEGSLAICEDQVCITVILQKLLKVSCAATEHIVTILWSLCCLLRDQKAQEVVNNANGFTKILLLMQSNCSPAVRQMSVDLLKVFRVNSKSCLSFYDTKTKHIMSV